MTPADRRVRAFVDRPVTDLDAARLVAERAADHWRLDAPRLVRAGMNATFAAGEVIVRVSAPSAEPTVALDLAAFWTNRGLAVPVPARVDVVRVGDLSATAWRRLHPSGERVDWTTVGRMVRAVHDTAQTSLPPAVPLPSPVDLPWWDFAALLDSVRTDLDPPARAAIEATIERHAAWGRFSAAVVCHGDVHPGNVIMTSDGPVLLDWDLLCVAPPGWDHAPMMTMASRWGGPAGDYEAFADGYGRSMRGDPEAEAFAALRLVAATLMRLAAGRRDPDAMAEAEIRLRYWRGEPDAPTWTPQ
jgi:aminoglycoside phosphotransferase (APT) family kinase protein